MKTTPLDELAAVAQQLHHRDALMRTRDRLILACREQGVPWKEIAAAIGVDPQVARNMGQKAKKRLADTPDAPR